MENKVLATVGEHEITSDEIENALKTMNQYQMMNYNTEEGKKQLLEDLINQELFYLEAKEDGLDKEESFLNELEKIKVNLMKQLAIAKVLNKITVTDEEKEAFYNDNKEKFIAPETASAKHILVETEEKANEILAKIKSEEISFEDAAKEFSTCPSNMNGGDLGTFSKGQMVPEFEEVVFKMNNGELSEPVKTQFGYHLIKLGEKNPSAQVPFEDVKGDIEKNLTYQKQNDAYAQKINELKAKYGNKVSYK
ncbi:MAG: peptidylprolyl isomerase [Clostridioides sp.]|jgi:peptidyl-prolyl cis-trans isomerase C|nr:peptidylprolyl isomerase [Clostridioides sp.]